MLSACYPSTSHKVFENIVGTSPETIHKLWTRYGRKLHLEPSTLLWTVSFLFQYPRNDTTMGALWKVCDKKFFGLMWPAIFSLHEIIDEISA